MEESWYALHIRPRFEKHVQMHLEYKGYEVFLPATVSKRRWSDRIKSLSLPLFPGYIFCKFDVNARLPILVTPGVNYVVGVGRCPVPVDPDELAAVHQIVRSGAGIQPWPYLKCGETVRIESGPLEGLTGIIVREKGCDRLVVSVTLLMRSVSVEIERASVKPVSPSNHVHVGFSRELTISSRG